MGLAERLAGRRLLLTGVTGFVGEALLHRILTDLPATDAVVLVRPKGSLSGADRVRQVLRKPIFAAAREAAGGVDELLAARLLVLEGDLAHPPELPGDLDVVVHCAGEVSFDPPIDEAFATNVVGTQLLLERILAAGGRPHYVHVSTAYVAGRRRGTIPEGPVDHDVDWRVETRWGLALRERIEESSRSPARLSRLRRDAEREHHRAGPITAARDGERRRVDWVDRQLVAAGGERARGLGWTDVYTFTKAMGERAVEELAATLPVSIVRPSIIESALRQPYPGWIEGFKMAEPLILAYGRGDLPEFPASPDAIVDVVPIDHVVGAILAVAADPPEPGDPRYFHVSSGARNPLTFRRLYELIRDYFDQHPFDAGERGAARLPAWRFPGSDAVERLLVTSERAHRLADGAIRRAPRGSRTRQLARKLDEQNRRLEFMRRYLDLYKSYTETELEFTDERTLALFRRLEPADRELFGFDTAEVDWPHYVVDVHCPSVTAPVRRLDAVRRRRAAVAPASRELPVAADVLAVFDMDGTLLASNVVESYLWLRLPELGAAGRVREVADLAWRVPAFLRAERRDRGGFLRSVYRRYAGADAAQLDRIVDETLAGHVLDRLSAAAVRRIRAHRAAGHRTVLLTGAIRPLTRPLAALFDDIVAADLAVDDRGRCTGFLVRPPLVGESRAAWLGWYAGRERLDLSRSYAYADSHSDLPMLRAVGNPVAVSPDVPLWREARRQHWPVEDWARSTGTARLALPDGSPAR